MITLKLQHNTDKSPVKFRAFYQDIEPHGVYYTINETSEKLPGFIYKTITFNNPLFIPFKDWKKELSRKYKAKGKTLSKKLLKAGFDGILTQDKNNNFLEIVNLKEFQENYKDNRKLI